MFPLHCGVCKEKSRKLKSLRGKKVTVRSETDFDDAIEVGVEIVDKAECGDKDDIGTEERRSEVFFACENKSKVVECSRFKEEFTASVLIVEGRFEEFGFSSSSSDSSLDSLHGTIKMLFSVRPGNVGRFSLVDQQDK